MYILRIFFNVLNVLLNMDTDQADVSNTNVSR